MTSSWLNAGWPVVRVRDIGRLHGGGTPSRKRLEFFRGTIPWITGQDIPEGHVAEVSTARDYVTEEAVQDSATRVVPTGAVLVTTRVSVGKTAVAGRPICFSQDVTAILIHSPAIALPFYVAHFLRWRRDALLQKNQGSTIAGITRDSLALEQIPLPPLSEQQRIVDILQEAEGIRRLRAEAEAKTAELIPAIFEEVFGDPVQNPRRWHAEPLASLINDTPKNGLYKPAELYGEGTPIIRIGDFTGGILRNGRNLQRVRITNEEVEQFGVCDGQILTNRVNSIEHLGKSLLVASLTEPTVYESNMMRLDPWKEKVVPDYLIACLQHASIVAKLRAKAKKAINQASINQTDVITLQIPVPPFSAQANFALKVAHAEELRAFGEYWLRAESALSAALSVHAFSGQLTADWREAHQERLTIESRERDAALKEAGAAISHTRRDTIQEMEAFFQDRTDGIYSDLNREQRVVLRELNRMVGGVRYARYFSAQTLSLYILEGPLRRNPQAIEEHLAVFAARGLIIPVSREEQTEDSGEFVFGNAYRLPLRDYEPREGEIGEPVIGDHARLREVERLAAQVEKERARS